MITKSKKYASETTLQLLLSKDKNIKYILTSPKISEYLKEEIMNFARRNTLLETNECCPQCLKAHIFNNLASISSEEEKKIFSKKLKCESGHKGYYLDSQKLFRI